jgi:hypothetical protein
MTITPAGWLVLTALAVAVGAAAARGVAFLRCLRPTKVRVRVVGHKAEAGGAYYALLYQVLEPKDLEGRYGIGATRRGDLVAGVDGGEFESCLNWTGVGALTNKPLDYAISPPSDRGGDFLETAERVR